MSCVRPNGTYGGETNAFANEPVIRPSDWEIELHCPEHGYFRVLAGNLIQPGEHFE